MSGISKEFAGLYGYTDDMPDQKLREIADGVSVPVKRVMSAEQSREFIDASIDGLDAQLD